MLQELSLKLGDLPVLDVKPFRVARAYAFHHAFEISDPRAYRVHLFDADMNGATE